MCILKFNQVKHIYLNWVYYQMHSATTKVKYEYQVALRILRNSATTHMLL